MRSSRWILAGLLAVGVAGVIPSAAPSLDAAGATPKLNKATGHYYEAIAVQDGINFADARAVAGTRRYKGVEGHLATIGSAQEYRFLVDNFPDAFPTRAPGTYPEECWFPTEDPNDCNFPYWLGSKQRPSGSEPDGGWRWITGEPWNYTNWAAGEPNDDPGQPGEEECLHPSPDEEQSPKWNDIACDRRIGGYFVEYPTCNGLRTTMQGTAKGETINGTRGRDVISAMAGNDTVNGRGGDDLICGDAGNDTILAGPGKDLVFGNLGADTIKGQGGVDTLRGGPGNDKVIGGLHRDLLFGDVGRDRLFGNAGPDALNGGPGTDLCDGGLGKDSFKKCETKKGNP